ncbi:enoyl-CoA hydratase/isomerase family protein [Kriegella sp. EG-1]|nr:enoyl-CoA hydratase/isomerase family protein [Flavobacteriaceae bacterium EG-1]
MKTLKIVYKNEYAIVQMNRGKVNAINAQMVTELREIFKSIAANEEVKGVILSGQPHYFSAGLDLIELFQYDQNQIEDFFSSFGCLYIELVQFKKPFISAITGYSPAGGCVLAVAGDNRYMAEGDKYLIGLNEVAVNIQISQNLTDIYAFWIGNGLASKFILEGKLLSGKEAEAAGLIDELVPLDFVLERAEKQMQLYMKADQQIWINTKAKIRKHLLDKLETDGKNALKQASELWWKPEIRAKMKTYVESFSNKKK